MVIFRNFEKSAYVPSKKYLHPPAPPSFSCDSVLSTIWERFKIFDKFYQIC